jgi:hypothetical protein
MAKRTHKKGPASKQPKAERRVRREGPHLPSGVGWRVDDAQEVTGTGQHAGGARPERDQERGP